MAELLTRTGWTAHLPSVLERLQNLLVNSQLIVLWWLTFKTLCSLWSSLNLCGVEIFSEIEHFHFYIFIFFFSLLYFSANNFLILHNINLKCNECTKCKLYWPTGMDSTPVKPKIKLLISFLQLTILGNTYIYMNSSLGMLNLVCKILFSTFVFCFPGLQT